MRIGRLLSLVPLLVTLTAFSPASADSRPKVREYNGGHVICLTDTLLIGNAAIEAGRCYVLAVFPDSHGTFLAFVDPDVRIPAHQVVRWDDTAEANLKGRIIYLVPMRMNGQIILIPANNLRLIQRRDEDEEEDEREHDHEHVPSSGVIVILPDSPPDFSNGLPPEFQPPTSPKHLGRPSFMAPRDWGMVLAICGPQAHITHLVAAIGYHETRWGQLGAGRDGWILGAGCPGSGCAPAYRGLDRQLNFACPKLHAYFPDDGFGYVDVLNFAAKVWKPGDPASWAAAVWNRYQDMAAGRL